MYVPLTYTLLLCCYVITNQLSSLVQREVLYFAAKLSPTVQAQCKITDAVGRDLLKGEAVVLT
jgi:hypothetical protein